MRKHLIKYLYTIIIISSCCLSCTKPVDFDQVDDLEISPVLESSLVYFNQPAITFLDNGLPVPPVQEDVKFDFFNGDFIADNLEKAEFVFEVTNSINRSFTLRVDFFDSNSQMQDTFTIVVPASSNNSSLVTNFTEVFQNSKLEALKSTTVIMFTLNMLPGTPINQNTSGGISLKSKAIFHFNIPL